MVKPLTIDEIRVTEYPKDRITAAMQGSGASFYTIAVTITNTSSSTQFVTSTISQVRYEPKRRTLPPRVHPTRHHNWHRIQTTARSDCDRTRHADRNRAGPRLPDHLLRLGLLRTRGAFPKTGDKRGKCTSIQTLTRSNADSPTATTPSLRSMTSPRLSAPSGRKRRLATCGPNGRRLAVRAQRNSTHHVAVECQPKLRAVGDTAGRWLARH